jgi:thioredoxin-like negative regulator of GroEL
MIGPYGLLTSASIDCRSPPAHRLQRDPDLGDHRAEVADQRHHVHDDHEAADAGLAIPCLEQSE